MLYRRSRDGFGAKDFHSKCDEKSPTFTIIKAQGSSFIFGGYTIAKWHSNFCEYRRDSNAFLFSLKNKEDKPCKMNVTDPTRAIFCESSFGPTFGGGSNYHSDDLHIADKANISYSNLGNNFKHPEYEYSTTEAKSFLAGSEFFRLNEIEAFIKS